MTRALDMDESPLLLLAVPELHKARFSPNVSTHRPELFRKLLSYARLSKSLGIRPIKSFDDRLRFVSLEDS
jgi:hypothetical protein